MHRVILVLALVLLATPAFAHTGEGAVGGLISGFTHPILGTDHLLAMIAVGLWGAQLGMPLVWVLPVTFPLVMAVGGLLGGLGLPLPGMEVGIALSVLVLGAMVAIEAKPGLLVAAAVVAIWAIFHGWAHGAELPAAADPVAYGLGFVIATGLLHLLGVVLGTVVRWPNGAMALRAGGVAIGVVGLWLLVGDQLA